MDTFDEVSGRRIETDETDLPPVAATTVEDEELESRLAEPALESVPDADLLQPNSPVDPLHLIRTPFMVRIFSTVRERVPNRRTTFFHEVKIGKLPSS